MQPILLTQTVFLRIRKRITEQAEKLSPCAPSKNDM